MPRVTLIARTALLIFLMAICLALASLRYVQPANCEQLCDKEPCEVGACKFGEQTAGFPLPVVRDHEIGSPPNGWGKVGVEDYFSPDIRAFSFNILFYSVLLLLARSIFVLGKRLRTRL
jgi:hypothetical protein